MSAIVQRLCCTFSNDKLGNTRVVSPGKYDVYGSNVMLAINNAPSGVVGNTGEFDALPVISWKLLSLLSTRISFLPR